MLTTRAPGLTIVPLPAWVHLAQRHLEKAYPDGVPAGQTAFTVPLDILRIGGKMPDAATEPFIELIIEYRPRVVIPTNLNGVAHT